MRCFSEGNIINSMGIYLQPGLFILKKDKETILSEIDSVANSFGKELGDKGILAECRVCRNRLIAIFDNYFADTRAKEKTIRCLANSDTDNVRLACEYGQQLFSLLYNLIIVVCHSVRFDDLPSCRSLLDVSLEEAREKALDLVGNGVVKDVAKTLSIGKDLYHFKEIADVQCYYSDIVTSFMDDSAAGLQPTAIEQLFELKCREELEYCSLAFLKVAGKLTKDLYEKGIEKAEKIAKQYKTF